MTSKNDRRKTLINIDGSIADQQPLEQPSSAVEPIYDVFLGGSCGNTCWRSDIVIPYLKKRAITYYDPQRPAWSENMIQEEQRAKENSRVFLFVLDPGTINATSFLEIAYLAARKASKLVVVFLGKHEWSDKALRVDLPDRIRTCNLLEAILQRHSVLMLTSIDKALDFVDSKIIGDKRWTDALRTPEQRVPFLKLRAQRCATRCRERWRATARQCRVRLRTHFKRLTLLLLFEAFLVTSFGFLLSTNAVPLAIPLWAIVLPLLAFNYMLLLGLIIYCRFKSHKRRHKVVQQRSLHLPVPPLPRVHTLPDILAYHVGAITATPSGNHPDQCQQQLRSFRHADQSLSSDDHDHHSCSSSTTGVPSSAGGSNYGGGGGGGAAYGPIIELLISGSTNGSAANNTKNSMQYNGGWYKMMTREEKRTHRRASERVRLNGCVTTPVGYDVFLSCSSSSELDWITQKAVPELHKNGLSYTSALMCNSEMRIPFLHTASHILYYIPSYKTFLSGMIEIAYFIGHADWQVTVCVPREAECLVLFEAAALVDPEIRRAVERRNECYRMAFSYLKDMAARRQVRVFTRVEDAIRHIRTATNQQQEVQQHHTSAGRDDDAAKFGTKTTTICCDQSDHDQDHHYRQLNGILDEENKHHNNNNNNNNHHLPSPNQQKRTALRQILEKQHLVKERTSANLLAHLREAAARGQKLELDPAEIRPDGSMNIIDLDQFRPLTS